MTDSGGQATRCFRYERSFLSSVFQDNSRVDKCKSIIFVLIGGRAATEQQYHFMHALRIYDTRHRTRGTIIALWYLCNERSDRVYRKRTSTLLVRYHSKRVV